MRSEVGNAVDDDFVRSLTASQNKLYAYILSLLPDQERARDVLQETNVALWRKAESFTPGTSFLTWACRVAYFEVLTERRRLHRDRHLFDDETLERLALAAQSRVASLDERSVALEDCLKRLPADQRRRIMERYMPGGSVKSIAEDAGKSPGAIATALHRIRASLLDCVKSKLVWEATT